MPILIQTLAWRIFFGKILFSTMDKLADDLPMIFVEKDGKLHEVKRMEVQENTQPILGHKGHTAHRLVIKTEKPSSIILPDKLMKDY